MRVTSTSFRCALGVVACCVVVCCVVACRSESQSEPTPQEAPPAAASASDSAARRVLLTDNTALAELAVRVLRAYSEKNVEELAKLGPPGAMEKLVFLQPGNPNYATLLGDDSWRMRSVAAWAGSANAGEIRRLTRGLDDAARAWYHADADFEYGVDLRKEAGNWTFFDLVRVPVRPSELPQPAPPTPTSADPP